MMDGAGNGGGFSKVILGALIAAAHLAPVPPAQAQSEATKPGHQRPVEPSAPTEKMNSPELPKKPDAQQGAKAPPGEPVPPEQPYPAKTKKQQQ